MADLPWPREPEGSGGSAVLGIAEAWRFAWVRNVVFIAIAMLICNMDRTALAVAGIAIKEEFGFSSASMGLLQSSYLWGYGAGQLPAGVWSDKFGGPAVMLVGLVTWSLATIALSFVHHFAHPLTLLAAARCAFGLASAVALPAVTATVSAFVPKKRRGKMLAYIYSAFNIGSIVGVSVTPAIMAAYGWKAAFGVFGGLGLLVAAAAAAAGPQRDRPEGGGGPQPESPPSLEAAGSRTGMRPMGPQVPLPRRVRIKQVLCLAWAHGVIGWGFFILLSWIPTYLSVSLPPASALGLIGIMSALPWGMCALVGVLGGNVADALSSRGWSSFRVRTAMHVLATLGPGLSILLLPLSRSPALSVVLLCTALGCQAFNYVGFHAHIQDVAAPFAGTVLAVTNTCGIVMGIAGNILTGLLLERTKSFSLIFTITALLYLSSLALWVLAVRPVQLFRRTNLSRDF